MSKFLDCNGVPLKVGDVCMVVKYRVDFYKGCVGKIITIREFETTDGINWCGHDIIFPPCTRTRSDFLIKLQDLDDDEILQNNVLFSTTTDTWERITDYPKQPTLEPELAPA